MSPLSWSKIDILGMGPELYWTNCSNLINKELYKKVECCFHTGQFGNYKFRSLFSNFSNNLNTMQLLFFTSIWQSVHCIISSSDNGLLKTSKLAIAPSNFAPPRWPEVMNFRLSSVSISTSLNNWMTWIWSLCIRTACWRAMSMEMQKLCHSKGRTVSFMNKVVKYWFSISPRLSTSRPNYEDK